MFEINGESFFVWCCIVQNQLEALASESFSVNLVEKFSSSESFFASIRHSFLHFPDFSDGQSLGGIGMIEMSVDRKIF